MAISAKRFSAMDTETNIGIATYGSTADSSIVNIGINDDINPLASVEELTNSAIERANSLTSASEDPLSAATRIAKGGLSTITDMSKLPTAAKTELLSSMTGGNAALTKNLGNVLDRCSTNKGLGRGLNGRTKGPSINCGNGNISLGNTQGGSGCNAYSYGDLLNKLTGGLFSSAFSDIGAALRAILGLAGYGYNLGMCGVFGALMGSDAGKSLSNMDLSRVSGSLLSGLGLSGNVNGFLDVAKSSAGLTPLISNPEGIQNFYTNFNLGSGITEGQMCTMADKALAGGDLISDSWRMTSDGLPSLASVGECNSTLSSVFSAKVANRSYGEADLDSLGNLSEDDHWAAAYAMGGSGSATGDALDRLW